MIRLARPWIGDEEQARVAAVLESGMRVQSAVVAELEAALAKRAASRTRGTPRGSLTAS